MMISETWVRTSIGLVAILTIAVIYLGVSFFSKKECKSVDNSGKIEVVITSSVIQDRPEEGYIVSTPTCHIPDLNPFAEDVMKLFRFQSYERCGTGEDATRIEMNWDTFDAKLVYNDTAFVNTTCCYSEVLRAGAGRLADNDFKLSACIKLDRSIVLPISSEFIYVKCESGKKLVYNNLHAVVRERPDVRGRLTKHKEKSLTNRPLSVFMFGIDSVSRLNFIRSMPKTYNYVHDNQWFELLGYNKIDDNTFPNLMGILTGHNMTTIYKKCQPEKVNEMIKCQFVWDDFRNNGYATAYGEDEASYSTFNGQTKTGFYTPPVDYYMRPYMLAGEKLLPITERKSTNWCFGNKESAVHIYDYGVDFVTHFKKDPTFSLFWTNSFSHQNIDDPTTMDDKIYKYMRTMEERGVLNESMVIFFSDHGMRYGAVRYLVTGWLEERLPFIYIWLPEWFKKQHPELVKALQTNRNRLTSPYDLHMTLKHIIHLANPSQPIEPADSCPKCQSLFTEVPLERTCEDAAIEAHWCTCPAYKPHDKNDKLVKDAVQFVLKDFNKLLRKHDEHNLCEELKFKEISDVRKSEHRYGHDSFDDYVIKYLVTPSNGWFESTVRYRNTTGFEISASMSRLDRYRSQSRCIDKDILRKYCYCKIQVPE